MRNMGTVVVAAMSLSGMSTSSLDAGVIGFQGLGDLSGGPFNSRANAVSADGSVVVGGSGIGSPEAFRWTLVDGMVGLGVLPGGAYSEAWGVSANGSVIVGSGSGAVGTEAFRWTAGGGMVGLGDLPGGANFSSASGVSADGSIVVGSSIGTFGTEAFRWTAGGGMVGLGILPGGSPTSDARGVSADGSVVVGSSSSAFGNNEAFRWTPAGGMVGLGDLPGGDFDSQAIGVSADGLTVVGGSTSAAGVEAFLWTSGGGMVDLGILPGNSITVATGASADGSVIVGTAGFGFSDCFVWDSSHGMRSVQDVLVNNLGLDLTGWTLTQATGISADGLTIVGIGSNPGGSTEAWIARIPAPSALPLVGAIALTPRRRRAARDLYERERVGSELSHVRMAMPSHQEQQPVMSQYSSARSSRLTVVGTQQSAKTFMALYRAGAAF